MKKILLGTSALVLFAGAAAAQQVTTKAPFTVTLGGSIRSDFAIVGDELADQSNREARIDYRLTLKAEAKAENGLTYGFSARLRNNQNGANQATQDVLGADVKFVYLSGSWGQVQLGDNIAASTNLEVLAPTVGIGQYDWTTWGTTAFNNGVRAYNGDTYDTKLTYYTPVFSGFQAGISYTPEQGSRGRDNARSDFVTGSGNLYRDLVAVAANYKGSFGDVGVKLGAGVEFGEAKDTSSTVKATRGDLTAWNVGAQLAYAGFTVGGNYFNNGDSGLLKGDDQYGWNVGLTYVVGPWGVGASYSRVETDPKAGKDRSDYLWAVGGAYQLAPGLSLQADVAFFDAESATAGVKAGKKNNEGTLFTFRTRVDF